MTRDDGVRRLGGYREAPSPPALAPWAEAVWSYERSREDPELPGRGHRVLPHEGVNVAASWRRDARGRPVDPSVLVLGPVRSVRFFRPDPGRCLVAVRLRGPWARAVLGADPAELADRVESIDAALGRPGRHLGERIVASVIEGRAADGLLDAIHGVRDRPLDRRVRDLACRGLQIVEGGESPTRAAERLGISPRHLHRVVARTTGVGPKYHQRVRRLDRVVTWADASTDPPWSTLAYRAGYCDQSHLNRDVRTLTGMTPVTLHAERRLQEVGGQPRRAVRFVQDGRTFGP